MVLFVSQTRMETKEGKNELEKIRECMQLRKIGMHEVIKDKAMEDGFNTGMINVRLKDKWDSVT
jgi:hypothetical protein